MQPRSGSPPRAAIVGLAGPRLSADEVALFRRFPPLGVIVFARNIANPAQLLALTAEIRDLLGEDAPILIDQEGGRVTRLRPPAWETHPPAAALEGAPAPAIMAHAMLLAFPCAAAGVDVVCAPVLDLRLPTAHGVIGDRAFAADPHEVARCGAAFVAGLQAGGVIPVLKHIPGHGRAQADSHLTLPRIEADAATLAADLLPFRALATAGAWAMTAHLLYPLWDESRPATLSPIIIGTIIRGTIGFDGVLISDDLAMAALSGSPGERAEAALAAGCDLVLHASGVIAETAAVLEAAPPLTARTAERLAAARRMRDALHRRDPAQLRALRDGALAVAATRRVVGSSPAAVTAARGRDV